MHGDKKLDTVTRAQEGDIIVDNTLLSDMGCSTRGAMRHVLGLTTAEADEAKELKSGSAIHESLAWWLSQQGVEASLRRFTEVYRSWSREHVAPEDPRAWKNLHRILKFWYAQRPLEQWNFRVEPAEVEVPLAHPLGYISHKKRSVRVQAENEGGEARVIMVALLDALGKLRTGGRWSIDHKSTGWTGDRFKDRQEDSSQFTGQMWLAKQRGISIAGIYINGLHVKQIPGSSYKCRTHSVPYAECGHMHLEHMLFPVTRTPHEIEAWERTARMLAQRFIRLKAKVKSVEDVRELPMEGRFMGMCGYCPFRDWCRIGRPAGAARTFAHRPWNPLDHAQGHVQALKQAKN